MELSSTAASGPLSTRWRTSRRPPCCAATSGSAADARVLFGAVLSAEDGAVEVGERSVVMENALRARPRASTRRAIGDDVLVGPHAHVNGA